MDASQQKAEEDRQIKMIRDRMPKVYTAIKDKAAELGNDAYALVRRGIRGEPGCFYATENGFKVGAYWSVAVPTDVAELVALYGVTYVCMWPQTAKEGGDGAN